MLTYGLFTGYAFGAGAVIYNIAKVKLQNDYEQEIRDLREYDLANETINV
jgi:hypothetical protein